MRIALIPLDERPVNTRYPAMIAKIAGAEVCLPPPELLSKHRHPANSAALCAWLNTQAGAIDAAIISCEMLGYGGLIASRITSEPAGAILARLDLLREIRAQRPNLPMLGFNLITRVSNADDAVEEPAYWAEFGRRMYRLSHLLDRCLQDAAPAYREELEHLRTELPAAHMQDFLQRRARNHTVNLAALQLLTQGVFDLLVLSSDDTSEFGLPSREKRWVAEWAERLGLAEHILMYPGADEVGCVLLARLINQQAGLSPRFEPYYAVPGGEKVIAAYEDVPVEVTIERQVRAVGGTLCSGSGDVFLAVNPPVERRSEWHPAFAEQEGRERLPHLQTMVTEINRRLRAGQAVVVADVAYPNGSDPVLFELLRSQVDLTQLAAYGGWNTAGNTIGTCLAQGCAALRISTPEQRRAQQAFLLHRILEDWGYQQVVQAQARQWLAATTGHADPTQANLAQTQQWIETRLQTLLAELPGFAGQFQLTQGSLRLPWQRTFEVDFELSVLA